MAIKLVLKELYKSIRSFPSTELPDFTIITGINGAGKSHLLEAIEKGKLQADGIEVGDKIARYDWITLNAQVNETIEISSISRKYSQHINQILQQIDAHKQSFARTFRKYDVGARHELLDLEWIINASDDDLKKALSECSRNGLVLKESEVETVVLAFRRALKTANLAIESFLSKRPGMADLLRKYCEERGKQLWLLSEQEIKEGVPLVRASASKLEFRLAEWFSSYQIAWDRNRRKRYYSEVEGAKDIWFTDEEFVSRYGPKPWEIINSVLERGGFGYRFHPPSVGIEDSVKFELNLSDPQNKHSNVKVGDLSSGEKIMFAVILLLNRAESFQGFESLPKMLLLDEIDAPLHPSFTRILLGILNETMVNGFGVKVIMTTHSPSTVALVPEESIYEMRRDGGGLRKVSRCEAVQVLSSGFLAVLPTSRYVVTESSIDASIYERWYQAFLNLKEVGSHPPLVFLHASKRNDDGDGGGKAQVDNWAEKLDGIFSELGFRGLVDKDTADADHGVVRVLSRYSIENFIFDPVSLVACFIMDGNISVFQNCSITNSDVRGLLDMPESVIQGLVDDICRVIVSSDASLGASYTGNTVVKYLLHKNISIPNWAIQSRGKDLGRLYKQVLNPLSIQAGFPPIVPGADPFKRLLDIQVRVLPEILPRDLRDTFASLL